MSHVPAGLPEWLQPLGVTEQRKGSQLGDIRFTAMEQVQKLYRALDARLGPESVIQTAGRWWD